MLKIPSYYITLILTIGLQSEVICGVWDSYSVLSTIYSKIIVYLWLLPTVPGSMIRLTYSRLLIYTYISTYLPIYLLTYLPMCMWIYMTSLTLSIHIYTLVMGLQMKFIILMFLFRWRFEIFHNKKLKVYIIFFLDL